MVEKSEKRSIVVMAISPVKYSLKRVGSNDVLRYKKM